MSEVSRDRITADQARELSFAEESLIDKDVQETLARAYQRIRCYTSRRQIEAEIVCTYDWYWRVARIATAHLEADGYNVRVNKESGKLRLSW